VAAHRPRPLADSQRSQRSFVQCPLAGHWSAAVTRDPFDAGVELAAATMVGAEGSSLRKLTRGSHARRRGPQSGVSEVGREGSHSARLANIVARPRGISWQLRHEISARNVISWRRREIADRRVRARCVPLTSGGLSFSVMALGRMVTRQIRLAQLRVNRITRAITRIDLISGPKYGRAGPTQFRGIATKFGSLCHEIRRDCVPY